MSTDLFGKPLAGYPQYTLSLHQKRQATLLYHWMSLDYLKGLKTLIDALIKGTDVTLELAKLQGRDELLTNDRWGVRDTSTNWSTFVFPALEDFRKSMIWHIAQMANEVYGFTGAYQCGRMINEFSSLWMTQEEEEKFKAQWEEVYRYASKHDYAAGKGGNRSLNDRDMVDEWGLNAAQFPRLPKFRVRTDVEGVTDKRPQRTGVYLPQDDPNGTLQFAWTGDAEGRLVESQTFNEFGLRLFAAVGRNAIWLDAAKMASFALDAIARDPTLDTGPYTRDDILKQPEVAHSAMAFPSFTTRPCKWYFVEMIDGEYDEEQEEAASSTSNAVSERIRCDANEPCPREGYWFTPAQANSRRFFKAGEVMPEFKSGYGLTIWQLDEKQ